MHSTRRERPIQRRWCAVFLEAVRPRMCGRTHARCSAHSSKLCVLHSVLLQAHTSIWALVAADVKHTLGAWVHLQRIVRNLPGDAVAGGHVSTLLSATVSLNEGAQGWPACCMGTVCALSMHVCVAHGAIM